MIGDFLADFHIWVFVAIFVAIFVIIAFIGEVVIPRIRRLHWIARAIWRHRKHGGSWICPRCEKGRNILLETNNFCWSCWRKHKRKMRRNRKKCLLKRPPMP